MLILGGCVELSRICVSKQRLANSGQWGIARVHGKAPCVYPVRIKPCDSGPIYVLPPLSASAYPPEVTAIPSPQGWRFHARQQKPMAFLYSVSSCHVSRSLIQLPLLPRRPRQSRRLRALTGSAGTGSGGIPCIRMGGGNICQHESQGEECARCATIEWPTVAGKTCSDTLADGRRYPIPQASKTSCACLCTGCAHGPHRCTCIPASASPYPSLRC